MSVWKCLMSGMTIIVLLAACQATPQTKAVHGAQEEQYTQAEDADANNAVLEAFGEAWNESMESYGGKLKVNINAEVRIPEAREWPVYRASTVDYTQEQVDTIADALFVDSELMSKDRQLSKEDFMYMLLDSKEALAEAKANNASDEEIQDIERHIENIQKDMQDVPDVTEYESVTKELVKDESGNTYLRASVNTGKGAEAYIWVQNNETGTSETSIFYADTGIAMSNERYCSMHDRLYSTDKIEGEPSFAEDEAITKAVEFLQKLKISDYTLEGSVCKYGDLQEDESYKYCAYGVIFTRQYNGVNRKVTYEDDRIISGTGTLDDGEEYIQLSKNDKITVIVDESGVTGMLWFCPSQIVSTETENVALMNEADTKNAIISALKSRYSFKEEDGEDILELDIKAIELGYAAANVKNVNNEYRLVPAWVVYDSANEPILGINATDGSIL